MSRFLPYDEALTMAQSLGLANNKEWRMWRKGGARPPNVPSAPDQTYNHDGWLGWEHWLRHVRPDPGAHTPVQATPTARRLRKRGATDAGSTNTGTPRGKQQRR